MLMTENFYVGRKWLWKIEGFTTANEILSGTTHSSDASKDMEVAAWKVRLKKDKPLKGKSPRAVAWVKITNLTTGETKTIYE